jgi:dTDP-4-amino-4,6-dideoxygalactose transaminase
MTSSDIPYDIPFNRPALVGNETRYMAEAVASGKISGDGDFSRRCHALLQEELQAAKVLLTTSCTHALDMTGLLLELQPGDEVILPSFTFVSTANAYALRGARPVFADSRPDTLNMDEAQLESLITPRTRAIVPVHYAGVGCEMDAILDIARRHHLAVIEDNAHGLFGTYKGRLLGSFGAMSTLSFHETKNFTCGEGGALVINDPRLGERAEIVREKGTNRGKFFRGEVDRYTWVDYGSSFLPADLLAAFLYAQLEERARVQARRLAIWERYRDHLADWAAAHGVRLPAVPPCCVHPAHIFYLLLPSLAVRQAFIGFLKARRILAVSHYVPLHLSALGRRLGGVQSCPVAEDAADRLVRLPLYYDLAESDQMRVIAAVRAFDAF